MRTHLIQVRAHENSFYTGEHTRTHFIQVRAHENSFYTGKSTWELILYRWEHTRTHFIQARTHEISFYTGKSTWELMLYRWKHTRTHFIQVKIFSKCWNDILTPFIFRGQSRSWSDGRWIYAICLSPLTLWVWIPLRQGKLDTTLGDKVCQCLAAGLWFSLGTPDSSTNKTDCHDITEILLKVVLNTATVPLSSLHLKSHIRVQCFIVCD